MPQVTLLCRLVARVAEAQISRPPPLARACSKGLWLLPLLGGLAVPGSAHAANAALTIETGSPDALCPTLPMTQEAVQRRLGELVVPSGSGWRARYTIAHAAPGHGSDFVRLELHGPDGTLQLSRDLPLENMACDAMAQAIALVLDRYFRKLSTGATDEPPPVTAPAPAAADPQLDTPVPVDSGAALGPARTAEPDGMAEPDDFSALSAEIALDTSRGAAIGLRWLGELWPHVYVGAALHLPFGTESEPLTGGGSVSARGGSASLGAAWGERWGSLRVYLGPALRLTLDRGTIESTLENDERYRLISAVGAEAGVLWTVGERLVIGATAALDRTLGNGQFMIGDEEVLRPRRMRGWVGIGAGYAFGW